MDEVLNPGSQEAALAGCTCPVHRNNSGEYQPIGGWVLTLTCPMHGPRAAAISVYPGAPLVHAEDAQMRAEVLPPPPKGVRSSQRWWRRLTRAITGSYDLRDYPSPISDPIASVLADPGGLSRLVDSDALLAQGVDPATVKEVVGQEARIEVVAESAIDDEVARQVTALLDAHDDDLESSNAYDQDQDGHGAVILDEDDPDFSSEIQGRIDAVKAQSAERIVVANMVHNEVSEQLPAYIVKIAKLIEPRVRELLAEENAAVATVQCPGRKYHRFMQPGWEHLRTPKCIHCETPNPKFTDEDKAEWEYHVKHSFTEEELANAKP